MHVNPELSERIEACVAVELLAAEIYMLLAEAFPDDRNFFLDLCHEEESHASMLTLALGFQRVGDVPDYIVPESFLEIYDTFTLVRETRDKIETGKATLKEALDMAIRMEESLAEKHFQDIFARVEDDSYIMNKLRTLQSDSKRHSDKIRDFMKFKNLLD